jgi:hypothetical protein
MQDQDKLGDLSPAMFVADGARVGGEKMIETNETERGIRPDSGSPVSQVP